MVEDWVWAGPDDIPGCGVTLALLYYFVPEAEEADLLDDLDREREQARPSSWFAEILLEDIDEDVDDYAPEQPEDLADPPMTFGQILGMLRHFLGAEIIDDDTQSPDVEA